MIEKENETREAEEKERKEQEEHDAATFGDIGELVGSLQSINKHEVKEAENIQLQAQDNDQNVVLTDTK